MARAFSTFLAAILIFGSSVYATDVCGNVSGTWTVNGSPYMVNCSVTVPSGQTLTIEPGVHVLFTGHYKFNVYGTLLAVGTEQDSIVFTRAFPTEESKWWGLRINGASSATHMAYCLIEYGHATGGGYDPSGGGISCIFSSPTFDNCTIQHNVADYGGGGVYCDTGTPHFTNCVIAKNQGFHSGGVNCWHSSAVFTNCTISHNLGTSYGSNVRIGQCNPLFRNCAITFGSGGPGVKYEPSGPYGSMDHCDVFGNEGANFAGQIPAGIGNLNNSNANGDPCDNFFNIQMDPLYVNAGGNDYHLMAGSPCIDAGNPASPNDPDGTTSDIGAHYFDQEPTYGFTGYVSLIDVLPTHRNFRLTHVSGSITSVAFTSFCPGTVGQVTGPASDHWTVMPNGDGNDGDSIIFVTDTPLTSGSIRKFVLRARRCVGDVSWCVGDTCGVIQSPPLVRETVRVVLNQNCPNPFNPTTRISFELAEAGPVRLSVFNLMGQEVRELINRTMDVGYHSIEFEANSLPSGIYIYRIDAPELQAEKKMLLVR